MNELGFKKLNEQTLSNVDGGRNTWQQNVGGTWGALGSGVICLASLIFFMLNLVAGVKALLD